ncbi:hypothetical protein BD289DRAFT_125822 [Coniella lustricola]|uniref:Uncharacterized protein n=1 Tax=Coniella lustricola TaxID=2025994 RepID=A0A2T3AFW9_9PEZI|nr:hypothetical protein BD289DRAFT_125822 [Coniella lustricola]
MKNHICTSQQFVSQESRTSKVMSGIGVGVPHTIANTSTENSLRPAAGETSTRESTKPQPNAAIVTSRGARLRPVVVGFLFERTRTARSGEALRSLGHKERTVYSILPYTRNSTLVSLTCFTSRLLPPMSRFAVVPTRLGPFGPATRTGLLLLKYYFFTQVLLFISRLAFQRSV